MLGSFEVRTDDGVLADVPGARLRGLLIALALEPGHVVPKATLVDWIWGEHPPSEAANALQRLVSRLRKSLPEGLVEGQTSFVGRDADVAAVRELIAGHRLTTLTGPGGSGKTRLATETARAARRPAGRGLAGGARSHRRGR